MTKKDPYDTDDLMSDINKLGSGVLKTFGRRKSRGRGWHNDRQEHRMASMGLSPRAKGKAKVHFWEDDPRNENKEPLMHPIKDSKLKMTDYWKNTTLGKVNDFVTYEFRPLDDAPPLMEIEIHSRRDDEGNPFFYVDTNVFSGGYKDKFFDTKIKGRYDNYSKLTDDIWELMGEVEVEYLKNKEKHKEKIEEDIMRL